MGTMLMMGWVLVLGISVISNANAQSIPLCAEQLYPCIKFMNSTNPPDSCCNPIKEINATQTTCFCELALAPGMLEGLGTTTAQALQLVHFCGVNFTITTTCKVPSAPPPSSSTLVQPPAMVGGDEGGTDKTKFTGLSFALFLCASLLFN